MIVYKERGGATFAIYPKNSIDAFKQVERLRQDGRIDMFAEAIKPYAHNHLYRHNR